jgi:hypothetical protein
MWSDHSQEPRTRQTHWRVSPDTEWEGKRKLLTATKKRRKWEMRGFL